jgi:riboflavin synthase
MFTGIVERKGQVAAVTPNAFGVRLRIEAAGWSYRPTPGDSIAVNGVCLTQAPDAEGDEALAFDVIRETLERTNLGDLSVGDAVNLESSLTAAKPIAGHFVQGHVDARGRVAAVHAGADEWRLSVEVDPAAMACVVPKGSIAIDGVSLTVAGVDTAASRFSVALIPTTLRLTTLGEREVGDAVNVETDMLARTVVHYLRLQQGEGASLDLEKLRQAGFVE